MTSLASLYVDRTRFELRESIRDRQTVVFSMLLPIFLLFIFGSVLRNQTIGDTGVTFPQYLVAGLLASGILYSAFQQLAIAVTEERANGTLKRLAGSPMPRSVFFVGKFAVSVFIYAFQALFLLLIGHALYDIHVPHTLSQWGIFVGISFLGLLSCSLLGIAFSSLAREGRAAAAVAAPLVLFFQFTSGVFFVYTNLPQWMQDVAALFPLKWIAQAMRGVFLPASFGVAEAGGSFEFAEAALVLVAWVIAGAVLCAMSFRWLPKGAD